MKVAIIGPNEFKCMDSNRPDIGRVYTLEDASNGTEAQGKAFHALVGEYFKSGLSKYQATTFEELKNCVKRSLGAGFEAYVYATMENGKIVIKDAKTQDDIPREIWDSPDRFKLVRGRLKSWADYTKKERRETMDRLISEMHQVGVQTKKFYEILEGMEALCQ